MLMPEGDSSLLDNKAATLRTCLQVLSCGKCIPVNVHAGFSSSDNSHSRRFAGRIISTDDAALQKKKTVTKKQHTWHSLEIQTSARSDSPTTHRMQVTTPPHLDQSEERPR